VISPGKLRIKVSIITKNPVKGESNKQKMLCFVAFLHRIWNDGQKNACFYQKDKCFSAGIDILRN
jgi:hypothetical protein